MSITWTADDAKAEGVASVRPQDLHEAIAASVVHGLRTGIDVELLDGLATWAADATFGRIGNQRDLRRRQLTSELTAAEARGNNARKNANDTHDDDIRRAFLKDATTAAAEARRARRALDELDETIPAGPGSPSEFSGEMDLLAQAIGNLARTAGKVDAEVAIELARVLEFANVDASQWPWVTFTFYVYAPADGRIAKLGPLQATVENIGYPGLLAPDIGAEHIGANEERRYLNADGELIKRSRLARGLVKQGWPRHSAVVAASTHLPSFAGVLLHLGRGAPRPEQVDVAFIEHVSRVYTDKGFSWRNGRHLTVSVARQELNDLLLDRGGCLDMGEADEALASTDLTRAQVALFSTEQFTSREVPWPATVERSGDWSTRRRTTRSVRLIACPHCGGWASKAVRAPEVPTCVLCPTCRRMPVAGSPVFPSDYFDARHVAKIALVRQPAPPLVPLGAPGSDPDELLTTGQSAILVGCSGAGISKMCDESRLAHVKRGNRRLIRRADLEAKAEEIAVRSKRWHRGRARGKRRVSAPQTGD